MPASTISPKRTRAKLEVTIRNGPEHAGCVAESYEVDPVMLCTL